MGDANLVTGANLKGIVAKGKSDAGSASLGRLGSK